MVRSLLLIALLSTLLVLFTPHHTSGSEAVTFYIETVVAVDGGIPSMVIDNSERPWIGFWKREGSFDGTMRFAVRDAGAWTFETVPFLIPCPTNTIIDSLGSPATACLGSTSTLHYLHKSGGVWSTESIGGFGPNASELAADAGGRPFAAYVWSFHYLGYISVSSRIGSAWKKLYQYESLDWFNPPWARVDITIDGNGDPHVCVNPTWSLIYYIGPGPSMCALPYMDNFSIAVDSQGQPMISYTSGGKLRIETKKSGSWETSIVGDVNDCGGTDLVIDANDVPHIAYYDLVDHVRKVFYAVNNGSRGPWGSWAIHEVDEGIAVSIDVDSNGHPHLAYNTRAHSPEGWDLKYATTATTTPVEIKSWGALKWLFETKHEED